MFLLAFDSKFSAFIHHHKTVHWPIFLKVMSVHLSPEDLKSQVSWLVYSLSKVPGYCILHISSSPTDFNQNCTNSANRTLMSSSSFLFSRSPALHYTTSCVWEFCWIWRNFVRNFFWHFFRTASSYRETNCFVCWLYFCLPHLNFSLFLCLPLGLNLSE